MELTFQTHLLRKLKQGKLFSKVNATATAKNKGIKENKSDFKEQFKFG
ncbi:hypothetical protein HMPREF0621_0736 [Pasteurella dagmatis ATCC 43325]|uniref:Uncharacterized protein n=1 Tax=Pasteurella dagmatis ATCC 43325 TaxID=667128 RepID=C9PP04_9PAST|nr:hypothetical protein HMPREF0621_0736 [Pasteurella dagmatis ATCC 43325]